MKIKEECNDLYKRVIELFLENRELNIKLRELEKLENKSDAALDRELEKCSKVLSNEEKNKLICSLSEMGAKHDIPFDFIGDIISKLHKKFSALDIMGR